MMKNVDFNAIVFKFVTPLLLFQLPVMCRC